MIYSYKPETDIMDQFLDPETDIKHQFLDPESVKKCQFLVKKILDPENDVMDQFRDPETGIIGERNYIWNYLLSGRRIELAWNQL